MSQLFNIPLERIATYLVMLSTDDLARVDRQPIPKPHLKKRSSRSADNGVEDTVQNPS